MYTLMVSTTTIRVDTETHARLVELSESTGKSLIATVRDAAEALHRQRFGVKVAGELAKLRLDPAAWSSYLAEAEATLVTDGLD
jgi:predicted transcriptional regulator